MPANLGMYFGTKGINLVCGKGMKITNSVHISHERISGADLEEKVPEDVKIVAVVKDELRKQKLELKEAGLALSGMDLIIRSFEIPFLPSRELNNAINFEAKKYLPFKIEDLIFDYQLKADKKEKKNLIIFLGIKKEIMDNYFSIMEQLGIRVLSLEYSAFSILRLMALAKLKIKGVLAIVNIDLHDETNFLILEDGFPLFARDIDLIAKGALNAEMLTERLKAEIQLSLDYYYHRRFFSKKIETMIFFGPSDYKNIIESWGQEFGLACQFFDLSQNFTKNHELDLSTLKAFSASMSRTRKIPLRFELISNWERSKLKKSQTDEELGVAFSLKDFRPDLKFVLLSFIIAISCFGFGLYQRVPLKNRLAVLINTRPKLITVSQDSSYDDLKEIDENYIDKTSTIKKLLSRYPYFTPEFNVLPKLLSKGVWLTQFNFQQADSGKELMLKGSAYFKDRNKEFEAINQFLSNLKGDPEFANTFKHIEIVSIESSKIDKWEVTSFAISCKD